MTIQDDVKIDFAALDPSRDRARWDALVEGIARKATRRPSVPRQVLSWARPTLTMAAAVALLVWGASALLARDAEADTSATEVLAGWAQNDEVPAPTQILDVLGASDASK